MPVKNPVDFDAFYSATSRRVVGYLFAMTGSRADAEDAVAEAFARAWERWAKISTYDDPEAWVRSVAWRISVSTWRRAVTRARAHRLHGTAGEAAGLSPDSVAIIAALRQIPASQRQAIVLYHIAGLTVDEIAREAGATAGAIRVRLSRGRAALAPHLTDDLPGTGTGGQEVDRHA